MSVENKTFYDLTNTKTTSWGKKKIIDRWEADIIFHNVATNTDYQGAHIMLLAEYLIASINILRECESESASIIYHAIHYRLLADTYLSPKTSAM